MSRYQDWLQDFLIGKIEVAHNLPDHFTVHSIRRFVDSENRIWEIALTYTGRLVTRSGQLRQDGVHIDWKEWVTQHDVEVPRPP